MTNEKAIDLLDTLLGMIEDNQGNDYDEAFKMGIKALEKQIPKKKHKYTGYRCVCGNLVGKNQRYCESCGQSLLDWSE